MKLRDTGLAVHIANTTLDGGRRQRRRRGILRLVLAALVLAILIFLYAR